MVPPGQDVIPRRPRGGASCKGVIPRRPRGDASLLGLNSIVLWWCLIMRIRIVKSWSLIYFDSFGHDACYLCLVLKLPVNCYKMRFLYTSLPFACLYVVRGLLYCDDRQPC